MAFSGILKLKFGPFWFKTSILLVNVVEFGSWNGTYVLRVERPAVCGGCIDLPIGRRDNPIALLPRSVDDRQKLSFSIRYGAKGKIFSFYAPSVAVYTHCIAVLREAFKRKAVKREDNKTASINDEDYIAVSRSDGNIRGKHTKRHIDCAQNDPKEVAGSLCVAKSSDANRDIASGAKSCSRRRKECPEYPFHPTHRIPERNSVIHVAARYRNHDDDHFISSDSVDPSLTPASQSFDVGLAAEQQSVYCVAQAHDGATTFSVYVPARFRRPGLSWRAGRVFNLPFGKWIQWIANDVRDSESPPEIFLLTSSSCERLQLSEMLVITQPFFGE